VTGTGIVREREPGITGAVMVFVSLAGVVCGMTLLFLAMRSVMEIGGSCGSDGVHVGVRPCPRGIPLATVGGILGGVVSLMVYIGATVKYGAPTWVWLAWPALFLSLGWNFLEFGLDPPGEEGLVWGWLVCGVVFLPMGGIPLVLAAKPIARSILPIGGGGPEAGNAVSRPRREPGVLVEPTYDPQPATAAPARGSGVVEALERLSALRESGALTEAEFDAAKERVLGGGA